MSPEERAALKAAVHTARKQRLAASVRGSELCRGCGWPVDDDTNWSCGVCRERVRSRHRHELEKRDREIAHLRVLLDEREARVRELRGRIAFMRAGSRFTPTYESEEERLEARRRSWRESKRRAAQRGKAAA